MKIKKYNIAKHMSALKYFSVLLCTIIILSCSQNKTFQNPLELETTVVISSDSLGVARELLACNNFLIVLDSKPLFDDNQLRVYDINSFKFITSA